MSDVLTRMNRSLNDPEAAVAAAEHHDWRVRYGAALALGRGGAPAVPVLVRLLERERHRPLYTQPRARFPESHDDTRMAEQLRRVTAVFDVPPTPEEAEAWKCRGRVKQAALFALAELGPLAVGARNVVVACLDDADDPVKMAAARALGRLGDPSVRPLLEALRDYPEWCTRTEALKALAALS